MKRFALLLFVLCTGLSSSLAAQVLNPVAETPLESDAKQIFLNSATGIPILQTSAAYIGLSPKDGSIIWESARNAGAALTEMASGDGNTRDYEEIPGTPYVFASGNLINVINGKTIIDGSERDLRILRMYYTMPESDMILLEIGGKGAIYLYAFNPFESTLMWDVQLREVSGLAQMASEETADADLMPRLNSAGNLVYANGKYLALVDTKTGELKWNEKIPAAYIFTNKKGNRMVIAEKRGGLGGVMASSMAGLPTVGGAEKERKFSKTLHLIDTDTGQSIWKKEQKMEGNILYVAPYDDGFMVIHDEGMNIYSFDEEKGEGRWKKDYKEKDVVNVEADAEGLMVYFNDKRMLVDPISGDEKWKKAEKLEKEPKGFLWGLLSDYEPKVETIGRHEVTFLGTSFTVGSGFRAPSYDYDMIIVEEDRIAVIDIVYSDKGVRSDIFSVIHLDGESPERQTKYIDMKRNIQAFDKTANGYFVYNDRGFQLYDYDFENGLQGVKKEFYPDPTAAKRLLIGMATFVGTSVYAIGTTTNEITSGNLGAGNAYSNKMDATNAVYNVGDDLSTREINGRIDDDFAFFFARDGKEGATLFKVEKNSGEEVAKFRFDDLTPLYEIDYQNGRLYYQANKTFKVFELE
jgi:outer membrane protein assembly factor BamB